MPEPRSFRTQGIILNRRDMGEADRLIVLFTPERGKIEALAKGARKPLGKKTGHLELFSLTDVLISKGRSFDILVQAEMIEPYLLIREDLSRGAYANYVVEALDKLTVTGQEDVQRLFALLHVSLKRLADPESDPRIVLRFFEIRLLDLAGFRPQLQNCVVTEEILLPISQYFSYAEGGVVSPEGARYTSGLVDLPLNTFKVLRHFQRSKYETLRKLQLDEATHRDLERIMLGYISYLLERQLQSIDFIRRIRRLEQG